MKILVCGNAGTLPGELKKIDIKTFDKVVRVNNWAEIEGENNRCDAWSFYPLHHLTEEEQIYDLTKYFWVKEYWVPHYRRVEDAIRITGRCPDHILQENEYTKLINEIKMGKPPRTGILTLRMAQLISEDVTIAGFDFYETEPLYYFKQPKYSKNPAEAKIHPPPSLEKEWVIREVKKGALQIIEGRGKWSNISQQVESQKSMEFPATA